ncbi:MAG: response regulator, partial [Bryobacteraceae bacterium]
MKRARVLVVDDEPGIRQSLCGVLEDEGYVAEAVETAEQALDQIRRQLYEVVLLDIWLPGLDGLE